MHFDVLLIYPLDNGLKSYIKLNEQHYLVTFTGSNSTAEFTIYSSDKFDQLITDTYIRKEIINKFILFLNQNKNEIKLGIYIKNHHEIFKTFFTLGKLENKRGGIVDVSFNFIGQSYSITNLIFIKNKKEILVNTEKALFAHNNSNCYCESIKINSNIPDFPHCLLLIEHQEVILDWILNEYLEKQTPKQTNKVIQFPKK